jgi:hypothetical protein
MNRQLHLLPHDHAYRGISEETKAVGRKGIAQARAALLAARTGRDRPPQAIARPTSHSSSRVRAEQRKTAA